ncbi:Hsp70 family protein, partial [Planctomycetota bacterium]
FYYELRQKAEAAKISLNSRKEVPIVLSVKTKQFVVKISQDQFHQDINPWIQKTLDAMNKAVSAAGLTYKEVDHIVLVGGTSKLPHIEQKVADATGIAPKTDIDPDKAISYGAAYICLTELAKDGQTPTSNGKVIPVPDVFVRDVTAHHVGCCVVDNSTSKRELQQAVIISKNTPIPCTRSDCFYLESEDQTEARIEILQGDPNTKRDQCLLIGEFDLKNLPREKVRTPRIQIEYVIDVNGMVTATATDKVSGKQQSVSVDYKKGVKPKDKPNAA